MKNILVAIDLEDKSSNLLAKAVEIAGKFGSKVWILHITAPDPDYIGYEVGPQYIRDIRADELSQEHRMVQQYANEVRARGVDAEGLVIAGATVEMILHESHKLKIELVIVGHHKHSLLYKLYAGNTDAAIVNRSKVPVMIVPL